MIELTKDKVYGIDIKGSHILKGAITYDKSFAKTKESIH